jgi:mannose-6-phosphate isomerase-like protein (cupin superfamily)
MPKTNLADAFAQIAEHWSPRVAAELNGQHVKLARVEGTFDWHHHPEADELFLVVEGHLRIERREDEDVELDAGELFVVGRGTEHRPVADEGEAHLLLFEPAGTRNTGTLENERTIETPAPL